MEFNPSNKIVQLCIKGMALEETHPADAREIYLQAWNDADDDLEKYLAAYYVARSRTNPNDRLEWFERALDYAKKVDRPATRSAFPTLYSNLAECYDELRNDVKAQESRKLAESSAADPSDAGPFYHGTRANLGIGDLLTPGGLSNYKDDLVMNHIYFTATKSGAGLAASLAKGEGPERVYIVEPTGDFENDPNVTDKKFPGNPTRSYRSAEPLRIVGEFSDFVRQTPEQLKEWQDRLAKGEGKIIN